MSVLNVARILQLVEAAEEDALEEVAAAVVADARARAPIRKVFKEAKGFRRKFRPLTSKERHLAIKRAQAYQGYNDFQRRRSVAYLRSYARAEVPRRGSLNALAQSRTLRNLGTERAVRLQGGDSRVFRPRVDASRVRSGYVSPSLRPLLTARGAYEVRSGRAIHREVLASGSVRIQIGGKLKASIESEGVISTGEGAVATVTAGVRYAKFVEFPTTHNAAQPFLLPALHDNRTRLKRVLAQQLRQKLGGQ
jgi:HK97 gp10 family phage protein